MTNETDEAIETATEEAPAPTLDDISQEFSVEEQVSNFQAQPEQAPQKEYFAPDPIMDPEAHARFLQQQQMGMSTLEKSIGELTSKVNEYEKQLSEQKISADVDNAVATVNEKLGADPEMVEIALEHQYRKDASFKKIWDNRNQNPTAFKKALGVVADKLADKFSISQDHQLTANQLAAKQSLKTMAKAPQPDPNDKWANMSDAEFQAEWDSIRRG